MRHVHGRAGECHIVARTTRQDKVRELQRTLYRAAKADPGRRFHALYDKIYRRDVLERAWELVRANRGAAGIDRQTIADVEQYGVSRLLDELAADLKDGRWRPLPARRVFIPKPGRPQERRPLSIPRCPRPRRSGGRKDRHRTDLRGRHARVLVRVSTQALGT
jgi:retron-type reverse transcriptase